MTPPGSDEAVRATPSRFARLSLRSLYGGYAVLMSIVVQLPAWRLGAVAAGIVLFNLSSLVLGIRAATRPTLPPVARRAWWLLSAAFLLLNLSPVGVLMSSLPAPGDLPPSGISAAPGFADLFRLLADPLMLGALLLFPRGRPTRQDGQKLLLDIVTVVGGSFMVLWYFVLGPVLTSDLPALTVVVAAAYPIGDLALIFGAAVVVLRGARVAHRRPMIILLCGLFMLIIADSLLGYYKIHPNEEGAPILQLAAVMTGLFLLALASLEQCLMAADRRPRQSRMSIVGGWLPYAALAAGCGMLIVVSMRSGLYPWFGLVCGGVVMTGAVAVRQAIAMRENEELLHTDSLTGLANRVRLRDRLDHAVDLAHRTGRPVAVLVIDMDGFKIVNDTLGHDAGDQLLVGFARLLRASVLGNDVVARLGGDEFAILLYDIGAAADAAAVADRIVAGMREPIDIHGTALCPAASIGIALTSSDGPVPAATLLHRADLAMYRAKAQPGNTFRVHDDAAPMRAPAAPLAGVDARRGQLRPAGVPQPSAVGRRHEAE